jgi:hypothetical protein
MTKPNPAAREALIRDVIASIEAEERTFQMEYWVTTDARDDLPIGDRPDRSDEAPASCETASCIAGHLEAVRPELAASLAPRFRGRFGLEHAKLAAAIYQAETGEECTIDFWGEQAPKALDRITREDAIAHVRGEHRDWPLLDRSATRDGGEEG